MALALRVLLERVRNSDGSVAQVLAVHSFDGRVRRVETGKVDKGEPLRVTRSRVPHDLRSLKNDSESGERIVQELLVHFRVQVADENVGTDVQVLLVSRGLVDANGLAK